MPRGRVITILGPGAEAWDGQGILVVPSVYDLEIRAGSGELLGLVERGGHGADYDKILARQPVTYRAVIREDGSYHPPSVKFPAGFIPPDPARATAWACRYLLLRPCDSAGYCDRASLGRCRTGRHAH